MSDPSCVTGDFRFHLEFDEIMELLMDRSLYPDPGLCLRELAQNSIDACRRKMAESKLGGQNNNYTPCIEVWDRTKDAENPRIVFQDNGSGMSIDTIQRYFLRIGRSYYRSPEFDSERSFLESHGIELDACSRFGIGIVSCFMIADWIEVETRQSHHSGISVRLDQSSRHFMLKEVPKLSFDSVATAQGLHDSGQPTGTRVTLFCRPEVRLDVHEILSTFLVNTEFPVAIYGSANSRERRVEPLIWSEMQLAPISSVRSDRISRSLKPILITSEIDLGALKGVRGRACFFFLKDHSGKPSVRQGFLTIESGNLSLAGMPLFLGTVIKKELHSNFLKSPDRFEFPEMKTFPKKSLLRESGTASLTKSGS